MRRLALVLLLSCVGAFGQAGPRTRYTDPAGGDWVAQVNALLAACGAAPCDVHTVAGNYTTKTGTVRLYSAQQTLSGDGPALVSITATQQNVIDWRLYGPAYTFLQGSSISGFTLTCANTDGTRCITIDSVPGFYLHDVNLIGPGGLGSGGPVFDAEAISVRNVDRWTERWHIERMQIGGFHVNLHFRAPVAAGAVFAQVVAGGTGYSASTPPQVTFAAPGGKGVTATGIVKVADGAVQEVLMTSYGSGYTAPPVATLSDGNARVATLLGSGTDSYAYGRLSGVWTNQGAGSYGVAIDAGAAVYHTLGFDWQVNSGGTTNADEYFHIQGGFNGIGFHVTGENYGAPFRFAHVYAGGGMQFKGVFETFGQMNSVTVDPGGAFSVLPQMDVADAVVGFGSAADYAGTGRAVTVYPVEKLQAQNPFVVAQQGYVEGADGASAPVLVHDARMPLCVATLPASDRAASLTQMHPTFCVSGNGDVRTPGGAAIGGALTAGTVGFDHALSRGGVPTIAALAGAGRGGDAKLSANATDSSGFVTVRFGAGAAAGAGVFRVGFKTAWGAAPKCWVMPASLTAARVFVGPEGISTAGFEATLAGVPEGAGVGTWAYKCEQ